MAPQAAQTARPALLVNPGLATPARRGCTGGLAPAAPAAEAQALPRGRLAQSSLLALPLGPLALAARSAGRQRRARVVRRCAATAPEAQGDTLDDCLPCDGGLAAWRTNQTGPEREVPVILFPITDLLLVGHTKRMHLFEPRWVEMIDHARRHYGGVIALVYFANDRVINMVTLAEVVACGNFGSRGRLVTVRGVSRARLSGLSETVGSFDDWGLGKVTEVPEFSSEDLEPSGHGGMSVVKTAAAELEVLLEELDLSEPTKGSAPAAKLEQESASDESEPELWTHERPSLGEDFASLAGATWQQRKEEVEKNLSGVHLAQPEPWPALVPGTPQAEVATFYAALGAAGLEARVQLFTGSDLSLSKRLLALCKGIQELQGMARARRALAGVFTDGDAS